MYQVLYYRLYCLSANFGIRLYRRWIGIIGVSGLFTFQAITVDTLISNNVNIPPLLKGITHLLACFIAILLFCYLTMMSSPAHQKIENRLKDLPASVVKKQWRIILLQIGVTLIAFILAGLQTT
ncbi:MAG: hypothetical protein EBX50_18425 [Chitinophagia bacterium]|jgi:hypothetical protein|nr:hypothetical protein [Chitinophagia bacterium]